jgi:hypothetical protein
MKKLICKLFGHNMRWALTEGLKKEDIGRLKCKRCGKYEYPPEIEIILNNYMKNPIPIHGIFTGLLDMRGVDKFKKIKKPLERNDSTAKG